MVLVNVTKKKHKLYVRRLENIHVLEVHGLPKHRLQKELEARFVVDRCLLTRRRA